MHHSPLWVHQRGLCVALAHTEHTHDELLDPSGVFALVLAKTRLPLV